MSNPAEGLTSQIANWRSAQLQYMSCVQDYKTELASLVALARSGHAAEALWLFQLQLMPLATQSCEYQMEQESDALNIANTIRAQITSIQNDYNQAISDIEAGQNTAAAAAAAGSMMHGLSDLKSILKINGMTAILGRSNISGMNGYISNVRWQLLGYNKPNAGLTGSYVYNELQQYYNQAVLNGQSVPPIFNELNSNFTNLNQSVSGVSSYIQTQMQYLNQNLQQYFSIYGNFFQDYNTLNSYIVSKSVGS